MKTLIYVSLALNIMVLLPILILTAMKSPIVDSAWGGSTILLFFPVPEFVFALLLVQVIYKITTPFTVGTFANPVVISNLVITAFFLVTLASMVPAIKERLSL
jgi:hypothetical protein